MVNDPIADMLSRIRNALAVRHAYIIMPANRMKKAIADLLVKEGYVESYEEATDFPPTLRVNLKYDSDRKPIISNLKRISKPGRRIYKGKKEIPWVLDGVGVAILSTSRGVLTDRQARRMGLGGEILCYVW
jgi:small subunit ribosomal protein S8